MSVESDGGDPRERIEALVLPNVTMEASRFCLEKCGFEAEALEIGVVMSAITSRGVVGVSLGPDGVEMHAEYEPLEIVAKCKGPRKRFLVAGELVCRERATVDKA